MATLADTKSYYRHLDWRCSGEHWATRWKGTDVQWYGTVLPRIRAFIPTCTIVEIGCGQGRLSQRLTQYCEQLILVDMTERCVRSCEQVFRDQPRVRTLLCNGNDLAGVEDASADFVFSLFSLVHADAETMRSYLAEIARVLNPRGTAFIHHSNGMACLTGDAQQTGSSTTTATPAWTPPLCGDGSRTSGWCAVDRSCSAGTWKNCSPTAFQSWLSLPRGGKALSGGLQLDLSRRGAALGATGGDLRCARTCQITALRLPESAELDRPPPLSKCSASRWFRRFQNRASRSPSSPEGGPLSGCICSREV